MTGPSAPPPAPGSLATEAGLLLDVLVERLAALQPGAQDTAQETAAGDRDGHVDGPACTTGCPFCQVLAVVRGERPETAARLVDGALVVVRGLRSLLDHPPHAPGTRDAAHSSPPASAGEHTAARSPGAGAVRGAASPGAARTAGDARPGTAGPGSSRAGGTADQAASTGIGTAPQARVEWIDIR